MVYLNTLYIVSDHTYLNLEGETVVVNVQKERRLQVPFHHLQSLVLQDTVRVSAPLLNRCAEGGLSVVWLERNGRFGSRLEGPTSGNVLLRIAQHKAHHSERPSTELARAFIQGKLANSRQVLLRAGREAIGVEDRETCVGAAEAIAKALRGLESEETVDGCRGREGQGSAAYFAAFGKLIRPQYRHDFPFHTRQRRPSPDPVNALLSFAYALLLSDCRSALETVGLDPQIGFLHCIRPGRASLALDLMEEFRPILADRLAVTLINRGQVSRQDFAWRPGGIVELSDDTRKLLISQYQARKKETIKHPLLKEPVPIGVLPMLQARLLARRLRSDLQYYPPFLYR